MHGQQNAWLIADRFLFGVIASWLVWYTGGLEAAIAVHGVNNLLSLGYAVADDTVSETASATSASLVDFLVGLVPVLIVAVVIARVARRRGVARVHTPEPLAVAAEPTVEPTVEPTAAMAKSGTGPEAEPAAQPAVIA